MGDFEMLCVLAGEAIGRVRVVPRGATPSATRDNTFELNALLTAVDSYPVMAALTHDMAKYSSVAGVQLKVLASGVLNIRTESVPRPGITDQWIVKSSGNDFPWLAANEFLCMSAAAKCGLRVPNVHLSEDHQISLVERFDQDPDGNSLGFEDIACLTGRLSHRRYEGTYEEVVSVICQWVTADNRTDSLEFFFRALVFNCAIENGDAHLKNFGVIYRDPSASVALAPMWRAHDGVVDTRHAPRIPLEQRIHALRFVSDDACIAARLSQQFASQITTDAAYRPARSPASSRRHFSPPPTP